MRRNAALIILIVLLLAIAMLPAMADAGSVGPVPVLTPTPTPSPEPTPEPIFLHLQDGQTVYMLCAEGLHLQAFGKEAGAGDCGP